MRILEPYQKSIVRYEGTIDLEISDKKRTTGYFEAVQTTDGSLALGCFVHDFLFAVPDLEEARITAVDVGGWDISLDGNKVFQLLKPRMTQNTLMTTILIRPGRLKACKYPKHDLHYLGSRFYITNLVMHQDIRKDMPESIKIVVSDRDIEIKPVNNYLENVEKNRAIPGIQITATVEIRSLNEKRHTLDEDADFMKDFVDLLRLWTGNKLDWIYGEALDDNFDSVVEVIHKDAITGEFSNVFVSQKWYLPFVPLAQSFFSVNQKILDDKSISNLISYFVDCCSIRPYLENRSLSAATLLDTLTLKYAVCTGNNEILSRDDFKANVLSDLKNAINCESLSDEVKRLLNNNLVGIYRTSFRHRLKLINTVFKLRMDSKTISRIVEVRDNLVHEGILKGKTNEKKFGNYLLILWTDFSLLCRFIGYEGDLPQSPSSGH